MGRETLTDARVARVRIHHSIEHPGMLRLPAVGAPIGRQPRNPHENCNPIAAERCRGEGRGTFNAIGLSS